MDEIVTAIERFWTGIKEVGQITISELTSKASDVVDDILGGKVYNFVLSVGDKAFGFFTPDNIGDFDFSSIILFLFGAVIIGLVLKVIQFFT